MARIPLLKKLLEQLGIEPERLQLHWVSASEGDRWAETVEKVTEDIKRLGPLHLKKQIVKDITDMAAAEGKPEAAAHS